jgi:nucleotide-binding universal stress UspA family protein
MPEAHAFHSIPSKILVPIDFSPSSQVALETAADLALPLHAALYLVNVIPQFPGPVYGDFHSENDFIRDARKHAKERLLKCCEVLSSKGIKATGSVIVADGIAENLVEAIEAEHVDLVVISTHGVSGWRPLVFGSTTMKLIKLAQCPLLLLRSTNPEDEAKNPTKSSVEWW